MCNAQTISIVVWGVLGIVGLLLAVSRLEHGKRVDWRIGLGIPMFALSLFVITITLPQYSVGFSIIGTLIMAGAALMAIKQSGEHVKSDKRERKLITIIEWTNNIAKCETEASLAPLSVEELMKSAADLGIEKVEAIIEYHDRNRRTNLIMRYQNLEVMRTRIVLIANSLDKQSGSNLGHLARQTSEKLEKHVKLGLKFIAGEITDNEYKEHWKPLVDSAVVLAEKAEEAME